MFGGTWFLTVYSVQLRAFTSHRTSVLTFCVNKHAKYALSQYAVSSRKAKAYIKGKQTYKV